MKKIMFNDRYGLTEAVLAGRKTQTRRLIKLSDVEDYTADIAYAGKTWEAIEKSIIARHAKYKVGEVVAVAQSYADAGFGDTAPIIGADENDMPIFASEAGVYNKMFVRADQMPHRIRITKVRVERLQDISDEDCIKEGIYKYHGMRRWHYKFNDKSKGTAYDHKTPREAYAALIDRISGKGVWQSNPYVFVYDFELVK